MTDELRQSEERYRLLAEIAEGIRHASDPDEILGQAARLLCEHLRARRCLIVDIDVPADRALVRAEHCRGVPSVPREYRVSDYSPLARAEMERGATIINNDSKLDPRTAATYAATYEPAGERAYIAVSLLRDGRWNGTLWLSDDVPRVWQPRELALVETVGERVWLATEKLRAEQALRTYVEQLVALGRASVAIHGASSVGEVLRETSEQARALIGAHQAITCVKPGESWGRAAFAASLSEKYAAWRTYDAPIDGSGIYALVCQMNRPMRLTEAELEAHPAWRGFGAEAQRHPPMRGWLAAPLTTPAGENLGLVQLSDKERGEFSATDEAVLVQLAQVASVAIENARLYTAAQEAVRVRDQFLSVAAHELKTPLTALLGYGQTLLRRVEREASLGERDKRLLRQTTEQALRLNRLIDALLDVGRIESGRLSIERRPLDLAALLQRTAESLRPTLEQHSLTVVGADRPLLIVGDELRLEQVFQNLLSNAVKYSPDGGEVQLALAEEGGVARVSVRDGGIGIPAAAIPQLFQRFYRVDEADRRHISGMGIGLYVVREIVGLHGGSVAVERAEGRGTIFTVSLPARAEPVGAESQAPGVGVGRA